MDLARRPRRRGAGRRAVLLPLALIAASAACAEPPPSPASPPRPGDTVTLAPELAAAVAAALERCEREPDSAEARLLLGMVYDANERGELAAEAYTQALERDPGLSRARYHLALLREATGDLAGAIGLMRSVTRHAPGATTAHGLLGQWLLEAGRYDEAEAAFAAAAASDADHPVGPEGLARLALTRGRPRDAIDQLTGWTARHPERRHARYLLGVALREAGELAAAREQLLAATPSSPSWPDPWRAEVMQHVAGYHAIMDTAVELGREGSAEVALPSIEALHDADPSDVAVCEKLVGGYLQTRRLDEARRRMERSLAASPDHPRLWFLMAIVHEASGRSQQALAAADEAIARQGSWAPLHELRARLLWNAGDLAAAGDALQRALAVGGDDLSNLLKLGRARALDDDWPAARRALQRATAAFPRNGQAWALLAEAQIELGDQAGAHDALQRARTLDPRDDLVQRVGARLERAGADG